MSYCHCTKRIKRTTTFSMITNTLRPIREEEGHERNSTCARVLGEDIEIKDNGVVDGNTHRNELPSDTINDCVCYVDNKECESINEHSVQHSPENNHDSDEESIELLICHGKKSTDSCRENGVADGNTHRNELPSDNINGCVCCVDNKECESIDEHSVQHSPENNQDSDEESMELLICHEGNLLIPAWRMRIIRRK